MSPSRRTLLAAVAAAPLAIFAGHAVRAAEPMPVVASFSILGDMVATVGGDQVAVSTLVGPDGDAHVYEPTAEDLKTVGRAKVVFVNGLGFEPWMDRLIKSSGTKATIAVASTGVTPIAFAGHEDEEEGHADAGHDDHAGAATEEHHDGEEEHAEGEHHHGTLDPHAWQDPANGVIYVRNIAKALETADPAHGAVYRANAERYIAEIEAVGATVRQELAAVPADRRKLVTSHDAFGYFGRAYGIAFLAPVGVSTESEASAADVAKLIDEIRVEHIPAVFMENITDPRLAEQIARETGARIGGELFSDALSPPDGPAATYIEMFKWNAAQLTKALGTS